MRRRQADKAFTLLELLVAVTITLLLAGVLLMVSTGTLNLMQRSQGKFSANAQAKMVLDMLERDLQSAIYRRDGSTWLAMDILSNPLALGNHGWLTEAARLKPSSSESLRLLPDEPDEAIAAARFGLSGVWLRFVTTNSETAGSLPVAVAYQLVRRPITGSVTTTNPASVRYTLCRAAVGTEKTFLNGYSVTAAVYGSTSSTPAATRSLASMTNPNITDALASNVADFGFWLYVRNTDGSLRRIFPETSLDLTHAAVGATNPPDGSRFPEVVDVMVRILSEEGATLLENVETGRTERPSQYANDADWWWGVAEAHSQVFVRRIAIKGAAL